MLGVCKLCQNEDDLQVSHFIPKFVGKWVKNTSATGYIRASDAVAKRAQDIAKEHWLCRNCEGLFSTWEKEFSQNIFYPCVDDEKSVFKYGDWMAKFCTSLSWRTGTFIRSKNECEPRDEEYLEAVNLALDHWANFLLGREDNLNNFEQHVIPLGSVESAKEAGLPENINRYFLRNMAMDIVGNEKSIFTYTKLPSFLILGVIKHNELPLMRNSRIALRQGKISPREYILPPGFRDYITDKAKEISELYQSIPEAQRQKIEQYIVDNPERAANSKTIAALLKDYEEFGDNVFR